MKTPAGTAGGGRCDGLRLHRGGGVAELDPAGEAGEAGGADDRRPTRREDPFIVLGMSGEEGFGEREVDGRVTQELEALVVAGRLTRMLMQPARMGERLGEEVAIPDGEAEAPG